MSDRYDVIVIGAGLGGLTAAALIAQAGRKTLLIERNYGVGGAASTYKSGDLVIEASLHETSNPQDANDPNAFNFPVWGMLEKLSPTLLAGMPAIVKPATLTSYLSEAVFKAMIESKILPEGSDRAREALIDRFPTQRAGITTLLREMEGISRGLGTLSRGREAFDKPLEGLAALWKLGPLLSGWRLSLAQRLQRAFGDDEAVKCALAANMLYWHDDPNTLWWVLFAVAQGGYLDCGGRYIKGGSQRLSNALAKALKAAGGELLLRRTVSGILLDSAGRPAGVVHERKEGGEPIEVRAPVIIGNAAPAHIANMLPSPARDRFSEPYAGHPLSISLFSATFGSSIPFPAVRRCSRATGRVQSAAHMTTCQGRAPGSSCL